MNSNWKNPAAIEEGKDYLMFNDSGKPIATRSIDNPNRTKYYFHDVLPGFAVFTIHKVIALNEMVAINE